MGCLNKYGSLIVPAARCLVELMTMVGALRGWNEMVLRILTVQKKQMWCKRMIDNFLQLV